MIKPFFLELKIPPVGVFAIVAGCMWQMAQALPSACVALPAAKPIAAGVAAAAGAIAAAAIITFIRARTTIDPMKPGKATALVTAGVYAITRNPMYLSLLFLLVSWAVYLSNLAALAVVPSFVFYMNRFQIMPEERTLMTLFGSEFDGYCKSVSRWL